MKTRHLTTAALAALAALNLFTLSGTAQAALISLGDGTVKDSSTNLIWLQDWNVNGLKNWRTHRDWALGLDFAGSTDWRLPEIGEYAALHAAYGDLRQLTHFTRVQRNLYWSGTELTAGVNAWRFFPGNGDQDVNSHPLEFHAVAVRLGDVTAAVPEPQAMALVLLALGAAAAASRRRHPGTRQARHFGADGHLHTP